MKNPKGYPCGVKNAENNERSVNAVQKLKEKPKKEEDRKIAALVAKLNQYRHEYYNEAKQIGRASCRERVFRAV